MRCVIISNGDINDYIFTKKQIEHYDLIICADGGAKHAWAMDLVPHVIVGDLDSIDENMIDYFHKQHVQFCKFPPNKDYTDTELAIDYALKKKVKEITFVGVIGSRMDHTIANVTLLLPLLNKGVQAKILNEHNEIIVCDGHMKIEGKIGEYVSIIPLSEKVEGITLEGLQYPLVDATILMGESIGVSNRFVQSKAEVTIKKGKILIIKSKD
ncbi:thiamine diphosphokinase [Clostridiaceae bacterium 35-E11]